MKEHVLRVERKWYDEITSGRKRVEIRLNDRDFKVGDNLIIVCMALVNVSEAGGEQMLVPVPRPGTNGQVYYEAVSVKILHIVEDFVGLTPGYVAMSFDWESYIPLWWVYSAGNAITRELGNWKVPFGLTGKSEDLTCNGKSEKEGAI